MSSCTVAALYVIGAVLEQGGIGLVAWDVLDSRRELREMSDPNWLRRGPADRTEGSLFELIARVSAGKIWRRVLGVALFALGLVIGTVGNLASLWDQRYPRHAVRPQERRPDDMHLQTRDRGRRTLMG